ncbi:hypothetical protein [Sphingosinicella terrae]|uniref:hypothetical protein n=1 Tax=Sphingosinicella terrae TaxID=2172047 RepID=UPI0013B3FA10|nr:hypothetical protein [Sphingosinicella terrae]
MSLLKAHWVGVGLAAAAAIMLPLRLVGGAAEPDILPPLPAPVQVSVTAPGSLAYALTAPPFSLGRAPEPEAAAADPTGADAEAAPPPAPPPTLVGLVIGGRGRAVALARGAAGETLTLARGGTIEGWTLVAISRDQAVFERDGERHSARLDFANRPAGTAPPIPRPPPPAVPARASGSLDGGLVAPPPSDRNP